jgi:hypothetical protein
MDKTQHKCNNHSDGEQSGHIQSSEHRDALILVFFFIVIFVFYIFNMYFIYFYTCVKISMFGLQVRWSWS